ncbi:alcohol dehydrogenase catalytic domain-containing protein [Mycolicibacterium sp. XJ1819]
MRTAVFQGVGKGLAVEERPIPKPDPRHVLIKVKRCGICGTDLHFTDGKGFLQMPPGAMLGHEFAGEVVEVGPEVETLSVGDAITALAIPSCGRCATCQAGDPQWCTGEPKLFGLTGAFSEYAIVAEPQAVKVPLNLSWSDGALVEPLAVGLHGTHLAHLPPGTDVLVIGAGPIALSTVYWARRMGAGRIVVQATSRRRERYAKELGASDFIVSGDNPVAEAIEALHGPPSLVFEAAGAPGTIEQAMQVVQPRGTVIVLGWCTVPDSYVPALYLMKQVRLQFSMTYTTGEFQHTIAALDSGAAEPRAMVSRTVSLDELPAVFESLRGPSTECKVLIDPWA